jgi:PAS domain S-box-containing protein
MCMNKKSDALANPSQKSISDLIELFDQTDWDRTALGSRKDWPLTLRLMVDTCLHAPTAQSILWGPDMIQLYNYAYSTIIGKKHPGALGASAKDVWTEIWENTGPILESVLAEGKSYIVENFPFLLVRGGVSQDCYYNFAYSPIYDESKIIAGIWVSVTETTDLVFKADAAQQKNQPNPEQTLQQLVKQRTYALQTKNLQLQRSEERYHKMIDEVRDYAIILLDVEGIIQNWNKGAEQIKQYTEQEAVGKNFRMFYLQEDQDRKLPEQLINEATRTGRAVHEGWRVRKDKTRFWGSIILTALHDSEDRVIGFSKVTRDLTERKRAEDTLQEYLKELETQNKELEQFAYIASHDLQEPLRKIRMFIDVIRQNFHDEAMVMNYFDRINVSASRMSELIHAVLNYGRLSGKEDQVVETDLNEVLESVRSDYELLIQDKQAVILSEPLPVIPAISLQVHQLFANLISNALKFTLEQPVVRIRWSIVSKAAVVHQPPHLAEGNYIELVFADNGVGFDQQYENIMFGMFQRLHGKDQFSGIGIGLALCKKIMENHGGYLTAKSEVGRGAHFYAYFPMSSSIGTVI